MSAIDGLTGAWRWSVRKILGSWVKATIKPEAAAAAIAACPRPVCYVLERESHADLAVLDNACVQLGMPRPERRSGDGRAGRGDGVFRAAAPRSALRLPRAS